MCRKTEMPPVGGCTKNMGFFGPGRHQWQYRTNWNGNNRSVLNFTDYPHGVSRSGWRCYHCGEFVWDETDTAFALQYAYSMGMIKLPAPIGSEEDRMVDTVAQSLLKVGHLTDWQEARDVARAAITAVIALLGKEKAA